MERSTKYNFYLPSAETDDLADVNELSYNFAVIDDEMVSSSDIDQTFDGTSENAQSGKAVAMAVAAAQDDCIHYTDARCSGFEAASNKVISLSSSSTDTQYPSAKCVYDIVGDIESALIVLRGGGAS